MFSTMLLTVSLVASSFAGVPDAVLNGEVNGKPAAEMMKHYFLNKAAAAFEERDKVYEALETPEDIVAYQEKMHSFFVKQLGGFPERTPLNARIVDSGECPLLRYEKVIFESRPNHFVTAILCLPKTQGPWPGVIVPCGHSVNGKANDGYQRAARLLAANGMASLCYDPIGQGERYTYLKEDGTPEFGSTLEHTLLGVGAILTGTNTATYRIWDGMRAIDYLQSRDDIITDKIGCTGNSGGGTLTSYLMALDERIVCAAPSCYLTSLERILNTIGAQDAEQNIFGQIAFGMDHADYIHMRAPKPTLMCTATQDFFDISGSWDTFREAKRLYTRFGLAERVDIIEYDAKHGFNQPLREGAARWMSRWLLDQDRVITEPDFTPLTDEEAQCTPEGQVMLLENAVSVLDLNAMRADQLKEKRLAFLKESSAEELRDKVKELIGYTELKGLPEYSRTDVINNDDAGKIVVTYESFQIKPEDGVVLPAILATPKDFNGDYTLVLHESGKSTVFEESGIGVEMLKAGNAVFAVDLRGMGETQGSQSPNGWHPYVGPDWRDYFTAYLLGKSYVGMRVTDIHAVTGWLKAYKNTPSVQLVATGNATVPALHAAALYPDLFDHITLVDGIPSWEEVVKTPRAKCQLINAVHDALFWYDLPDLVALIPEDKVEMINAHVPVF